MRHFSANPSIGVDIIRPDLSPALLEVRARQLAHVVADMQNWYVQEFPDTVRIDTDPLPNPDDPKDRNWRIERLQASGDLQTDGLLYVAAHRLDGEGDPSAADDAIVGLTVFGKPDMQLCTPFRHTPTEIVEFYVRKGLRETGLGRTMLQTAAESVHPQDRIIADVAVPNIEAQRLYKERYRFYQDHKAGLIDHGVFNFPHIRLFIAGARFCRQLGVKGLDTTW